MSTEQFLKEQTQAFLHEISTPVASIRASSSGTVFFMSKLIEGYKAARQLELVSPPLDDDTLMMLKNSMDLIALESDKLARKIAKTQSSDAHQEVV